MSSIVKENKGYTLLEMLCVVAIIMILVNIGAGLFSKGLQLSAMNSAALDRIHRLQALEQGFVEMVQHGSRVVAVAGPYVSDKKTLVLALPESEKGHARYCAVQWQEAQDRVRMIAYEVAASKSTVLDMRTYTAPIGSVQFGHEKRRGGTQVWMDISLRPLRKNSKKTPVNHQILATLRSRG